MTERITPEKITHIKENEVFVFGSNLSGRHGKGAAKTALGWGCKMGTSNRYSRKDLCNSYERCASKKHIVYWAN